MVEVNKINTFTLYMFGVKIVHELLVIIFVTSLWKRRNHFLKYQVNFGDALLLSFMLRRIF